MGREHMREDPLDGQGAHEGGSSVWAGSTVREDPLYEQGAHEGGPSGWAGST